MSTKSGGDNDPINEEYTGNVTEVGAQAVWSLSSCKPGKRITLPFCHLNVCAKFSLSLHIQNGMERVWC